MRAAIFSTYPPRACGLATFARDLRSGLQDAAVEVSIVASVRERGDLGHPEVVADIVQDRRSDYARAAQSLDVDVVSVQHEFGIFGGPEGRWVTDFMDAAAAPVVTTLHTVLPEPSESYRRSMTSVLTRSARMVVMTETARDLLCSVYGADPDHVAVIPHGTPTLSEPAPDLRKRLDLDGRTVLLTFGLLGPSKGIEFALDALVPVVADHPETLYVILGATHPEIVKNEGEAYRELLQARVADLGLTNHVRFVDRYVDGAELGSWLQAADVYVSPYPGMDQICSGTLAYALAAGLPVVSTPYLHAAEVLADGAGTLVELGDTDGFGEAIAGYVGDSERRAEASRRALAIGAPTSWPQTGEAYRRVFQDAVADGPRRTQRHLSVHPGALLASLDALVALTDDTAPIQHAVYGVPDRRHGYSADDAARALVVLWGATARGETPTADRLRIAQTCLAFLRHAQRPDGAFRNFMDYDRRFRDTLGDDTTARAIWGLGAAVRDSADRASGALALEMIERALDVELRHPCAHAYAMTGLDLVLDAVPDHGHVREVYRRHALVLADHYRRTRAGNWHWFSDSMTYANALLPHAMLRAAERLPDVADELRAIADESARFALAHTVADGRFEAIGNDGWMTRSGHRAVFDQQPIEAGYAAWFWADAADLTGDNRYAEAARAAVAWFYGDNRTGEPLFDPSTGACFDGLTPDGVNRNQGAESVIAGALAHLAARDLGLDELPRLADRAINAS